MLAELKIVSKYQFHTDLIDILNTNSYFFFLFNTKIDENGLNIILKNWISSLGSVHEAVIKRGLAKLNVECKSEEKSINSKVSQHDATNFKNITHTKNSINTEKLTTPKQQAAKNGASGLNYLFKSTMLKNLFIALSLSYSFLRIYI